VEELSRKIGLKQIVLIFESLRVKTPVVIGYLKPVILLPLGMISGLPQDQVEALIVHELVHIRRYDFIVNILESFIETIFFFHPLVWWISHQINAEREHCCDDAVVNLYGGTIVYTKALYNLEQIRSIESGFALAATGKKNQLYRRIIRMNTKNNNTVTGVRIAAFALLLIAMAAVSIYSSSLAATSSPDLISASFVNPFFDGGEKFSLKQPSADPVIPDTLSLKKGARTIKFSGDLNGEEKKFKARLKDGKLEELFIDGEKVAPADLPKYENMVVKKTEEYDSAMRNYREAMKNYKTSLNDYKEKMKQFRGNRFDNEYNSDFRVDSLSGRYFDSSELREAMKELRRNLKESFADKSQSMPPINIPQINIPPINIPPIHIPPVNLDNLFEGLKHLQFDSTEFNESMKEFNEKMKDFKFDMEKFKKEMKNNFVNNEAFRNNMKELKKNMGTLKEKMRPLKGFLRETRDEMIKDNLIEPGEDLDGLKLTKEGMYLNGKKMSDDQHKKYLGIYKKHFGKEIEDDDGIDFNN
jgi:tetratricopeptide (TPR) repeat protein